ncbi:Fucose permease [Tangfeifania diversioriginum]|uniref:Fucose permease n=1 Tax=Tangfeifania diversioriginum TaxID=1168035 RepID=A0A1M6E2R9_9BACT|nr:MFS transporter [Tangfeifania diversioriginum]SHI79548.1 Fucose permease [Tangfeifania diversioriginum]
MNKKTISVAFVTPVLLSFFVMSACDLVGISVDNVKADFGLNNTLSQLIPLAVFAWFFLLSVPTGLLQDRIGKRNMLNIGILLTAVGLFLPFFVYSFLTVMIGFGLLGIGNTIIQVSANPLLIDVVPPARTSSFLSFSQFVKSIGSMIAPYMATYFALHFGDWKLVLLSFGLVSLLSAGWLHFTKITESLVSEQKATLASSLKLLGVGYIALMVLGIFFVVGLDVGINATSGQFLLLKMEMNAESAQQGRSLYFFGKMLGTFLGALLLVRFSPTKFLIGSATATLVTTLLFIFSPTPLAAQSLIFLIGLTASNIFPLIFTLTVKKYPTRANEISGLMIMAVSGGAIIPPIVGGISDLFNITTGMYVFVFCAIYLLFISIYSYKKV